MSTRVSRNPPTSCARASLQSRVAPSNNFQKDMNIVIDVAKLLTLDVCTHRAQSITYVCVCVDALRWLEEPKGLNRAWFASTLPRVPTSMPSRPHIHLLLPFRRPLFIRSPGIRGETWPHASSHGPNNGGHTRAPGLLFARSCFDEVGTRPHNTHGDLLPLSFSFLFSTLCFRPSPFHSSLSAVSFVPFYAPVLHVSSSLSAFWPLKPL